MMSKTHTIPGVLASVLLTVAAAMPLQAGDVTVAEGETAQFQITVTPKYSGKGSSSAVPVRLWYQAGGGTADEGVDYRLIQHFVDGNMGQPLKFSVNTFEDNEIEGDETFNIRIVKLEYFLNLWGQNYSFPLELRQFNFNGTLTATIKNTTIRQSRQQHGGCGSNAGGC